MPLDAVDLKILCALRRDSRLSLRDIAAEAGVSAPSVNARIKRLEDEGVITGYTVNLKPGTFGLALEALILLTVPHSLWERLKGELDTMLAVSSCVTLTGPFSHAISASFPDVEKLTALVEYLNANYGHTQTSIVLRHEIPDRPPLDFKE